MYDEISLDDVFDDLCPPEVVTELDVKKELKEYKKRAKKGNNLMPEARVSLLPPESQFKIEAKQLFYLDRMKVAFFNQIFAEIVNRKIAKNFLYGEICELRKSENTGTKEQVEKKKKKIAQLIKKALGKEMGMEPSDAYKVIVKDSSAEYKSSHAGKYFDLIEGSIIFDVEQYLETIPLYNCWMKKIDGLGVKTSAKLLVLLGDIKRFGRPSSVCHYSGIGDPNEDKLVANQRAHYNPKAKSLLLGVIAENFLRANSQYRVIYDKRKQKTLRTHPEWHNLDENGNKNKVNKHPFHAHKDAKRVMMKRFLQELWDTAWRVDGEEPPASLYTEAIQGHTREPNIVQLEH